MPNPTKLDKQFWDTVASIGCIACIKDGYRNPIVSIHHINGRTKLGAHRQVLPLCAGHHQDGTGNDKNIIAVHPFKKRFEAKYGKKEDLLAEVMGMINAR